MRNPKSETNLKSKIQNGPEAGDGVSVIRALNFEFVSDFDLRASNLDHGFAASRSGIPLL
jgi:hypothetical protein